jgi:hypothetical protein
MRWRVAIVFLVAGCFDPKPETGLLCDGTRCPPGQVCYSDGYCRFLPEAGAFDPVDGGGGRPDAGGGGQPDAAIPSACVYSLQSGCDFGEGCYAFCSGTVNETYCAGAGTNRDGQACESNLDCAAGYTCFNHSGLLYCRRSCNNDSNCVAPGGVCFAVGCNDVAQTDWGACTANCDPLSSSGCPSGGACRIFVNQGTYYTTCFPAGAGGQSASCTNQSDCLAGYTCTSAVGCTPSCIVGQTACGNGHTCRAFTEPRIIGGVNYGACVP